MTEGRRRNLVRWGLALTGVVGFVVLLAQFPIELVSESGGAPSDSSHHVEDINAIGGFHEILDEGQGHVRVVLLLSPT